MIKNHILCICFLFHTIPYFSFSNPNNFPPLFAEKDSISTKHTIQTVILSSSVISSYLGLNYIWYNNHPRERFHFFNDLEEWDLMDKVGHGCTAYQLNKFGYKWLTKNHYKSPLLKSTLMSFGYMFGIEFLDGFSEKWGFSWYDIGANAIGNSLYTIQQHKWGKQHLQLKFSYSPKEIAECRPSLLGKNHLERILKDYNGQTYWLTYHLSSFRDNDFKLLKFIDIALGYSIDLIEL